MPRAHHAFPFNRDKWSAFVQGLRRIMIVQGPARAPARGNLAASYKGLLHRKEAVRPEAI